MDNTTHKIDYMQYVYKYYYLIKKKKVVFIACALALMTLAVIYSYLIPKTYSTRSVIFIERSQIQRMVGDMTITPSLGAQIRVLTATMLSRPMLMEIIRSLDLDLNRTEQEIELLMTELRHATRIDVRQRDGMFTVQFQHQNPMVARDYVNNLVRRYLEQTFSSKRDETQGASFFFREQVNEYKQRVDQANQAIMDFNKQHGYVLDHDTRELRESIASAEARLEELQIRKSQLQSQSSMDTMNSLFEFETQDPHEFRLANLESRLDNLLQRYGEAYPEVLRVKAEIERLQQMEQDRPDVEPEEVDIAAPMASNMFNIQLSGIQSSENRLRRQIAENQRLLEIIPALASEMSHLRRERDEHERVYAELIRRQTQSQLGTEMELQDRVATFRIIEPAVLPLIPSGPNRPKIMIGGMAFGIFAAFGLIFLLDFADRSVRDVSTLKHLGLPVLAVIPRKVSVQELQKNRRNTILLLSIAGIYLAFLLSFVLIEILGIKAVDEFVETLQLRPIFDGWMLKLKQIYWSIL